MPAQATQESERQMLGDRLNAQVSRLAVEPSFVAMGGQCGISRPLSSIKIREGVAASEGGCGNSDAERTTLASNPKTAAIRCIVRSVSDWLSRLSIRERVDCFIPQDFATPACVKPALFRHARTCSPKLIILLILLLAACTSKPAPIDNAYCRLYVRLPDPSDAVHMKKRENKLAVLANEQSWLQFCGSDNSGLKGPI